MNLSKNSFNARYMSYEAVAETFIYNKQFDELLSNSHSVLMGPRGCGKTTLLKMLQPVALHNWKGEEAEDIKRKLDFWAVYIPTDNQWNDQLKSFEIELKNNKNADKLFKGVSNALVCLNVIKALCATFKDLICLSVGDDSSVFEKETRLVAELINAWDVPKPITPSFYSLDQYILKQVSAINSWRKEYNADMDIKGLDQVTKYNSLDFIDLVNLGCKAFQQVFNKDVFLSSKDFRWALCFDELEIAPGWLRRDIFSKYIRSTDNQKLLFKITSAPLMEWEDIFANADNIPSRDNDYNVIRTWVYDQNTSSEWKVFCEQLYEEKLKRELGLDDVDLNEVFGRDDRIQVFEIDKKVNSDNKSIEKYDVNSSEWLLFVKWAKNDPGFRDYLIGKGIDPDNPIAIDASQKDSVFRKILPIIIWRNALLKDYRTKRTRKNDGLYFGLPLLYELSEGNPRAAINIISQFVQSVTEGDEIKFSPQMQHKVISTFSTHRLDFFNNYPNTIERVGAKNEMISMGDILMRIGDYFKEDIIGEKFNPDIKGSFIVDKNTPEPVMKLVNLALSLGAVQYMDPTDEVTKNGLINKRFKLAYTLYPFFKLLTRYDTKVNLSRIVNDGKLTNISKHKNWGVGKLDFGDEYQ